MQRFLMVLLLFLLVVLILHIFVLILCRQLENINLLIIIGVHLLLVLLFPLLVALRFIIKILRLVQNLMFLNLQSLLMPIYNAVIH